MQKNENNLHSIYGGSPISVLSALTRTEFLSIFYLRCFSENINSKKVLADEFSYYLGKKRGLKVLSSLDNLYDLLLKKGRKDLILHSISCNYVGVDENSFIHLISCSICKEKNDALLIATIMTNSHTARSLIKHAQDFAKGITELLDAYSIELDHLNREKKYN